MTTVLFTKTCGRDLPLAKYQAGLIRKHWKNTPYHVWVVDSEEERRELHKVVVQGNADGHVHLTREVLGDEPHVLQGYLCQQVVKLLAQRYCAGLACNATFQIDADCMPCAPFDWDEFQPVWEVYDRVEWPIPHVAKQIPKWNALVRELLEIPWEATANVEWTFMTGLGWWVPNEVGSLVIEQVVRKVLNISSSRSVMDHEIVEAFRQLQARGAAFSEYTFIGHAIVTASLNRKLFRDYAWDWIDDSRGERALPRQQPAFQHITMQPGGNDWHLPDVTRAQLDALLEVP